MMWRKLVSASTLANRLPAYKNVLALVPEAALLSQATRPGSCRDLGGRSLSFSFAVSDPYLSSVAKAGILSIRDSSEIARLINGTRTGALILSCHPLDHTIDGTDDLSQRWNSAQRFLQYDCEVMCAEAACFGITASEKLQWKPPISSAVERDDVQDWWEDVGGVQNPSGGAAALQLQAWLDDVQGGWPNSFG
mmetsp:Transcript_28188/g.43974  ORF Transcript_28188/g.43974 Transcript_28188/m.43974 type:complete len:193 (+) Transcript_28188:462-1040(+)